MFRSSAGLVLALLLWAHPAAAAELPVLFIHGFCSSAETWNDTLPQLSTRRYGVDVPRVYVSAERQGRGTDSGVARHEDVPDRLLRSRRAGSTCSRSPTSPPFERPAS